MSEAVDTESQNLGLLSFSGQQVWAQGNSLSLLSTDCPLLVLWRYTEPLLGALTMGLIQIWDLNKRTGYLTR